MNRLLALSLVGTLALGTAALPLVAQDNAAQTEQEQRGGFLAFVEDRISTPERQIRISNIDGILSSQASIAEITISDQEGVWLRINNASIDWNQAALLMGRLEIRSLKADSIDYPRNSIPAEGAAALPPAEAGALEVPQFPVAIILNELSVPKVTFGESVFGLASEISVAGNITLDGGSLDTDLNITRLDGPGGTLAAKVAYARDTQNLDLGVTLTEPANGIIANLLNIDGRPDVALSINGSGPVSNLRTELTLDAGGSRALAGVTTLSQQADGMAVSADLGGPIANLMAEPYRPFFGGNTTLNAEALIRSEGGLSISALRLAGGQLNLEATAETTPDNFLRELTLSAMIADGAGGKVVLPVAGGATRVDAAQLAVSFGQNNSENWTGNFTLNGFETEGLAAETVQLNLGGVAANLDSPTTRRVTFNGDGAMSGIATASAEVREALGDSIGIGLAGLWNAGQPIELAEFRVVGKALTLALAGQIEDMVYDGTVGIETASIAPFSGLAGRDLSGALKLDATGTISPLIGGFDLNLKGTGDNLTVDDKAADAVLAGQVNLSGRVARTEGGIEADTFMVGNKQVQFIANGIYATGAADFTFALDLADLALISDQAQGQFKATGSAVGQGGIINLSLDGFLSEGSLAQKPIRDGRVGFAGQVNEEGLLTGDITGEARLDGTAVKLASAVSVSSAGNDLTGLQFTAGPTSITGNVSQNPDGLLTGNLALASTDVATAAALALVEASGAANAEIALTHTNGLQAAEVTANVADLQVSDARIGSADLRATIDDLFGVPRIDGTVNGSAISAAGVDVTSLAATASRTGDTTLFDVTAALATGTDIAAAGNLAPQDQGYRLGLDRVSLRQGDLAADLAQPVVLLVDGANVALDAVRFNVGSGSITASGSAGQNLDITVGINALPLSIANAIAPDLGLAGTLNGDARITGTGSAPNVAFEMAADGVNAAAIREFGIAPLSASVTGSFADQTVRLQTLRASGSSGLTVNGGGTVPLAGNGLNINLTGSVPLSLANRFVADRGGQASGTLNLDASVTGSIAAPQFGGRLSVAGAEYIDPALNLRLQQITGSATLSGTDINVDSLTANLSTGGSISASGPISLNGQSNLAVRLNSARYADGNLFVATVSGGLSLSGSVLANPLLSGEIFVEEANITVPESLGGGAALIDVKHVAPRPAVEATIARAKADQRASGGPSRPPSVVQLDINVNAPNQIFIRGRGLDAEVGGSVRMTGTVTDIQPVGAFELNRGRLSILGQRITFESGTVTLVGDLDPYLNLVASTEGEDITVYVTVSGRASEIDVSFSSTPMLPQDEVLSRLLFNRSMGELSPLQLARLAGAAAELAGGSNSSLLDSLRESTGLADLDFTTDDEGNAAVQAGAYIQDNVYLGVQAGANGDSKVTIDLDITNDVKARGAMGSDGNSSLGVFYERDY